MFHGSNIGAAGQIRTAGWLCQFMLRYPGKYWNINGLRDRVCCVVLGCMIKSYPDKGKHKGKNDAARQESFF